MALQHTVTLPTGIVLTAAYARINRVSFTHDAIQVNIDWWANEQARIDELPTVRNKTYSLAFHEPTSLQSCYNVLKAHSDFTGSVDV